MSNQKIEQRCLEYSLADEMHEQARRSPQKLKDIALRMARLSVHDELTGLYNRRALGRVKALLMKALGTGRINNIGIIVIDLDGFKDVNDGPGGHAAGDRLLQDAACVFQASVREKEDVFRTGGDEFTIVIPNESDKPIYEILEERIKTIFDNRDKYVPGLHFSWGIAYVDSGKDIQVAIDEADSVMFGNKRGKKR